MQSKASHNHPFSPPCGDIRRPSLNASILLLCQINRKRHCHSRTSDVRCTLAARATVGTKQQADIVEAGAAADTDVPGSSTPSTIEGKIAEGVQQEPGVERKQAKPTQKPVSVSSQPLYTIQALEAALPPTRGVALQANIKDVVGFEVDFLIPTSKAAGFILGVGGKRLRYLMHTHEIVINMTPGSRKPLRTMGLTARSASSVVAFWEDVLSMVTPPLPMKQAQASPVLCSNGVRPLEMPEIEHLLSTLPFRRQRGTSVSYWTPSGMGPNTG